MRILIVTQYFYPESLRINDIAKSLVDNGHEVTVLTGLPNYPSGVVERKYRFAKNRREIIDGIEVIRTWVAPRGKTIVGLVLNYTTFAIFASLRVFFLRKDYDVVYVYQLSPVTSAIPALIYKKLTGKKILLYCLDLWPESVLIAGQLKKSSLRYRFINMISLSIYQKVDRILVSTEAFATHIARVHRISQDKFAYLPQYEPNEKIYLNLPVKNHNKNRHVHITLMGTVNAAQDIEKIIMAIDKLRDQGQIVWHIVGGGSCKAKAKEMARRMELKNVTFYGQAQISLITKIFEKTNVFIVSLKSEQDIPDGLPGRIQTFMASGRAIIGMINGSSRDIITKSKTGLAGPSGDYSMLAENIRKFVNQDESKEKFGLNGRNYYLKNFSKKSHIEKLILELNTLSK